jgi:uncharacterized membrane protein
MDATHRGVTPLRQALERARAWEQHYVPRLRRVHLPTSFQAGLADRITAFAGSMPFVYLHAVWFIGWVLLNEGAAPFDPFPFGLLTLIVSLEAIFLSTFVMIAQNRLSVESEARARADYEVNLRAEAEIARLNHLLESLVEHHVDEHGRYEALRADVQRVLDRLGN